jgi:hypothetical protein
MLVMVDILALVASEVDWDEKALATFHTKKFKRPPKGPFLTFCLGGPNLDGKRFHNKFNKLAVMSKQMTAKT